MTDIMAPKGYKNPLKDAAWRSYLQASDDHWRGNLPLRGIEISAARTAFENWYEMNYEGFASGTFADADTASGDR